jgi:hypothetical protein
VIDALHTMLGSARFNQLHLELKSGKRPHLETLKILIEKCPGIPTVEPPLDDLPF